MKGDVLKAFARVLLRNTATKAKLPCWLKLAVALALVVQLGPALAAASVELLRASGARVVTDARTGVARFVGFDAQAPGQQPADAALRQLPAQAAAAQHLSSHAGLFGLRSAASETRTIKHRVGKDGSAMTRYQQQHQGIPVIAGELIVNQTAHGQLTSISGKISPQLTLDTMPVYTAQEAKAIARQAMAKWYQLSADEFVVPEPTLSVYDSRLMSPHSDPVALVWRLNVTTRSLRPINEFVAVDAKTGRIALHFNQVPHAKNRQTYDAAKASVLPGKLVCNETNPACAVGIEDAFYVHVYTGKTYDFYLTNFGRDGIDAAGMPMISSVQFCETGQPCPFTNAFWNGIQMVYGEGYPRAQDIVAHELTHGVTDYESQLFYYYQSGAINESLSDVFGEFIQQSDLSGTVNPATRWRVGEDLRPFGAIRSMSNPPEFGDPDRMTSTFYYTATGDDGGVHINSGVNNKAAFLMVDGGVFNGRTVGGIGLTKAAKIYYRVQTALLISGSDYADLHNALYQACQDLIGTAGIGAADCLSVQNATLAVEMNLQPTAGFNPEAAQCPAGRSVSNTLFSDNLESGVSNWLFSSSVGTDGWSGTTGYATSGTNSLYGPDPAVTSDLSASLARDVTLPANAHLWFKHAFGFERGGAGIYYDGGVLEYSSNRGSTWNDAGPLYAEGQNYGGTLTSTGTNPLRGRAAFVAESHGYVSSRYNLSTLAGQTVRFRWRIGADESIEAQGWYVDDVKINSCAASVAASSIIDHYYQNILNRVADSAGKVFWQNEVARMSTLGVSASEAYIAMARSFFTSSEFVNRGLSDDEFVQNLYRTFFNRAVDQGGLDYWTGELRAGLPRDMVMYAFMFSSEFRSFMTQNVGANTQRAEIGAVVDYYRGAFGRLPDDAGLKYWVNQFRSAQCASNPTLSIYNTASSIAGGFFGSAEYLTGSPTASKRVSDLYNTFMRRGADLAGFNYWVSQLSTNAQTYDQVRKAFIDSAEFAQRAQAIAGQGCTTLLQ